MSIYFASLFCPEYDHDLIDHWCRHYRRFDFDCYIVYLHSCEGNREYLEHCQHRFRKYGFITHIIDKEAVGYMRLLESAACKIRKEVLDDLATRLTPADKLVIADSDEFHDLPSYFREIAEDYDIVKGRLVDRYCDNGLPQADSTIPLSSQYPCKGDVNSLVYKTLPPEYRARWPKLVLDKIICARADLPVQYTGSHFIHGDTSSLKTFPTVFDVEHYRWRASLLNRLSARFYFRSWHIWYFMQFFNVKLSDSQIETLEKSDAIVQSSMGWV